MRTATNGKMSRDEYRYCFLDQALYQTNKMGIEKNGRRYKETFKLKTAAGTKIRNDSAGYVMLCTNPPVVNGVMGELAFIGKP